MDKKMSELLEYIAGTDQQIAVRLTFLEKSLRLALADNEALKKQVAQLQAEVWNLQADKSRLEEENSKLSVTLQVFLED